MPVGQAVTATRRLGRGAPAVAARRLSRLRLRRRRLRRPRGRGGGCGLVREGAFDEFDDLGLGAGGTQGRGEVLFDQGAGQLGEQLEVLLVRAFGGRDEEDQVRGAVLGAEVDRLGEPGHGQRRFGDRRRTAVRDGDAAGDAGGGLLFPGEGVGKEAFNFGGASVGGNFACQVPDHVLGRAAQVLVELDQFGGNELSHCQSFRRAVMVTASGVVWWTAGTVEPGSEAAAAPWATA